MFTDPSKLGITSSTPFNPNYGSMGAATGVNPYATAYNWSNNTSVTQIPRTNTAIANTNPPPTQPAPTNNQPPSGGGGGMSLREQMQRGLIPWDDNALARESQSQEDPMAAYRREQENQINSGYNAYFSQLDSMLNEGLPQQRTAQENIVQSQYNQGVSNLNSQKEQGLYDLNRERQNIESRQAKTLNDLAGNLRNSFMAGNVYLGARGAGDSSAANQYAYALTKLGSQQRGDILSQTSGYQQEVSDREFKLNNIYNSEMNRIVSEKDQKINGITSWFAGEQNKLKEAKARGELSKSQDLQTLTNNILSVALQQLQIADQEQRSQQSMLESWALNNATTVQQAKANLAGVADYRAPQVNAQPILGAPRVTANGGFYAPVGYGGTSEKKYDIHGRPIA